MFGFRLDQAKTMFFDRKAVTSRLSSGKRKALNRTGGYARKTARNSIKSINRAAHGKMVSLRGELRNLHPRNPRRFVIIKQLRSLQKQAHSQPGKPPKSITGKLKKNIFYGYDSGNESVVVGPVKLNGRTNAHRTLEFGGKTQIGPRSVSIEARPYMGPAKTKTEPKMAEFFKNCMEK